MVRLHVVTFALCALVPSQMIEVREAAAQEAQLAVIEGYAFHEDTLKPLKNVRIELGIFEASSGFGVAAVTDDNGFYSVSFEPTQDIQRVELRAGCFGNTTGVNTTTSAIYVPTRPIIYQRNLYVKPPRGSTRCY